MRIFGWFTRKNKKVSEAAPLPAITEKRIGGVVILKIPPAPNNTLSSLMTENITRHLQAPLVERVIVDLSGVRRLGSSEIGSLVGGLKQAKVSGVEYVFAGVPAAVQSILKVTNLDPLLDIRTTLEEAMEKTAGKSPDEGPIHPGSQDQGEVGAPATPPSVSIPAQRAIPANHSTGDSGGGAPSFVEYCFVPVSSEFSGIEDEEDPRIWYNEKDLQGIPALANGGDARAALDALNRLPERYADFYFVYGWKILLLVGGGDVDGAREILLNGLCRSKRKSSLCANFATAVFNRGLGLEESIQWWIISARMQLKTRRWTTHDPFLYLSCVAKYCGDASLAGRLLELSDTARPGDMLRLNAEADQGIAAGLKKARGAGNFPGIEAALARLKAEL